MFIKRALMVFIMCLCMMCSISVYANFSELKPSQPADFDAVLKNDGTVIISWKKALYADGYNLEKSFDGITYETVNRNIITTQYIDSTKTGHIYYRITPYNKNGIGMRSETLVEVGLKRNITFDLEREFVSVAFIDNYLYALGSGDNLLTILKVENDEILFIKDVINEKKFTSQLIHASGDYLYIATKIPRGGYNVMVYSVKNREQPIFKKAVATAQIRMFYQNENYLFGAAGSSGVAVFDVKEPEKISFKTYISVNGTANACYVDDDILFVTTEEGELKSYNITNLKAAFGYEALKYNFKTYVWQQTTANNWTGERGGYLRTYSHLANLNEIVKKDGIVYVASAFGIKISDFGSYKKPEYITPVESTVKNDFSAMKLIAEGDCLYSIGAKFIKVYNISKKGEAVLTDTYIPVQESEIADVCVFDDKIVVINKNGFITLYNK